MVYICKIPSPAGQLTLSSNGKSITGLWIEGQKYYGSIFSKYFLFYPSILAQKHIFLLFPFYCAKLFILLTQKTGDLIWNC